MAKKIKKLENEPMNRIKVIPPAQRIYRSDLQRECSGMSTGIIAVYSTNSTRPKKSMPSPPVEVHVEKNQELSKIL